MPKLKLKPKKKARVSKEPPPKKKSAVDEEIEAFRNSPGYTKPPHDPAAEVCEVTGVSHKVNPVTYVMSTEYTGWCCVEVANRLMRRMPFGKIKAEVSIMFRPKTKLRKIRRKIKT